MVAYSFKQYFAPQIVAGSKSQTVRADRKRHARPGETLQLFVAMRTKHCRKLLDRDPLCVSVAPIHIEISTHTESIAWIEIDGRSLARDEIEEFATLDGFGEDLHSNSRILSIIGSTARARMGLFWLLNHDAGGFDGVVIRWDPSAP